MSIFFWNKIKRIIDFRFYIGIKFFVILKDDFKLDNMLFFFFFSFRSLFIDILCRISGSVDNGVNEEKDG